MHPTPIARDFFLANFYSSGPFNCIFSKTSLEFFLCWLWPTPVPVWARRRKQVALLIDAGSHVECLRNITRLQNMLLCILVIRDIFVCVCVCVCVCVFVSSMWCRF